MTTHAVMTPEFVMFGVRQSETEVHLWASRELSSIELETIVEEVDPFDGHPLFIAPRVRHITLGGTVRRIMLAAGPTYAGALASIEAAWRLEDEEAATAVLELDR